jgi:hypothetical protein
MNHTLSRPKVKKDRNNMGGDTDITSYFDWKGDEIDNIRKRYENNMII